MLGQWLGVYAWDIGKMGIAIQLMDLDGMSPTISGTMPVHSVFTTHVAIQNEGNGTCDVRRISLPFRRTSGTSAAKSPMPAPGVVERPTATPGQQFPSPKEGGYINTTYKYINIHI